MEADEVTIHHTPVYLRWGNDFGLFEMFKQFAKNYKSDAEALRSLVRMFFENEGTGQPQMGFGEAHYTLRGLPANDHIGLVEKIAEERYQKKLFNETLEKLDAKSKELEELRKDLRETEEKLKSIQDSNSFGSILGRFATPETLEVITRVFPKQSEALMNRIAGVPSENQMPDPDTLRFVNDMNKAFSAQQRQKIWEIVQAMSHNNDLIPKIHQQLNQQ